MNDAKNAFYKQQIGTIHCELAIALIKPKLRCSKITCAKCTFFATLFMFKNIPLAKHVFDAIKNGCLFVKWCLGNQLFAKWCKNPHSVRILFSIQNVISEMYRYIWKHLDCIFYFILNWTDLWGGWGTINWEETFNVENSWTTILRRTSRTSKNVQLKKNPMKSLRHNKWAQKQWTNKQTQTHTKRDSVRISIATESWHSEHATEFREIFVCIFIRCVHSDTRIKFINKYRHQTLHGTFDAFAHTPYKKLASKTALRFSLLIALETLFEHVICQHSIWCISERISTIADSRRFYHQNTRIRQIFRQIVRTTKSERPSNCPNIARKK